MERGWGDRRDGGGDTAMEWGRTGVKASISTWPLSGSPAEMCSFTTMPKLKVVTVAIRALG